MEIQSKTIPTSMSPSTSKTPVRSLREVIQYFTPAWFSLNMGTGVISALLHNYPYGEGNKILNSFALAFFFLNVMLFFVFLGFSICRCIMFPRSLVLLLRHPVQSLYLGVFPMGAVTLINVALTLGYEYWRFGGKTFLYTLWALWWLVVFLSFLCCFGLVYVMTVHQEHSMSTLTPIWLLPIVTLIVASSTGQLFVGALNDHSPSHASITLGFAIIMVVMGISLSLMILTLYLRRLFIDGLPDVGAIISSFLPLGACGQSGYSFLLAGKNLEILLPRGNGILGDESFGRILNPLCFAASFILWCMAIWWLMCALMAIVHTVVVGPKPKFQLQFWGLIFPNGLVALHTIELSKAMDSDIFRMIGAIYAAATILLWVVLAGPTLLRVYDRSLFPSPCMVEEFSRAKTNVKQ